MDLNLEKIQKGFASFIDTKVSRLEAKHKVLILLFAMILPSLAFFFLGYSPKDKEIKTLNNNKSALLAEISKVEATVKQLAKHQAEMKETELLFRAASLLLPEKKEIPSLLTNISGLGTNSGLEFLSFKPVNETPKTFYAEIPVNITVRGPYHNVGEFLNKISKLPRIVTVSEIGMGSPTQSGNEMLLNTTFNLVTYRFIEPPAAPGK
jgi:type IV pilus assembly protein PilO